MFIILASWVREERFSLPIHCLCGSPGFDSHKAGILMYLLTTGFIEDDDLLVSGGWRGTVF